MECEDWDLWLFSWLSSGLVLEFVTNQEDAARKCHVDNDQQAIPECWPVNLARAM
jgi:hypothetical protein